MPMIPDYFVKLRDITISPNSAAQTAIKGFLQETNPTRIGESLGKIQELLQKNHLPTPTSLNAEGIYQEFISNQYVVENLLEILQDPANSSPQVLSESILKRAEYVIQQLTARNEKLMHSHVEITSPQHLDKKSSDISHLNGTARAENLGNWSNVTEKQCENLSTTREGKKTSQDLFKNHKTIAEKAQQLIQKRLQSPRKPGEEPKLSL